MPLPATHASQALMSTGDKSNIGMARHQAVAVAFLGVFEPDLAAIRPLKLTSGSVSAV